MFNDHRDKCNNLVSALISSAPWIVIYGYLVYFVIIPFFLYNNLLTWDMAGLYAASKFTSEHLFPNVIGWNPYFFAGFPQNQFYNPLFPYLVSIVDRVLPFAWAFKAVVVATILLLPYSVYRFAKAYSPNKEKALQATIIAFIVFCIAPWIQYGGTLASTLDIGLVTHTMGMVLFFMYGAIVQERLMKKEYVIPSFFLALLILSHMVAALAAAILLISSVASKLKEKSYLFIVFKHGIIAFFLTAFWIVPFLAKRSFSQAAFIPYYPYGIEIGLITLACALIVYSFWKRQNVNLSMIILSFLIILLISPWLGFVPFHYYRLFIYLVLLCAILLGVSFQWSKSVKWIVLVISAALLLILPSAHAEGFAEAKLSSNISMNTGERVMVIAPVGQETTPQVLQHQIPLRYGVYGIKGLYVESSLVAPFVFIAEIQVIGDQAFVWGVSGQIPRSPKNSSMRKEMLKKQLNLLGVRYVVIPSEFNESIDGTSQLIASSGQWHRSNNTYIKQKYIIIDRGEVPLVEIVQNPLVKANDWKTDSRAWFASPSVVETLIVREVLVDAAGSNSGQVEIRGISPNQDNINFTVRSEKAVPVLIKVAYFPNWKLYLNGNEVLVQEAGPSLMLAYGKGDFELRYEKLPIDWFGEIVTIAGIVLIASIFVFRRKVGSDSAARGV